MAVKSETERLGKLELVGHTQAMERYHVLVRLGKEPGILKNTKKILQSFWGKKSGR